VATTRIYIVGIRKDQPEPKSAEGARLVEATSQAAAIRHVAARYKAEVASGMQIRDLMRAGVIPEVAGEESEAQS
jgi:hypothetical protein